MIVRLLKIAISLVSTVFVEHSRYEEDKIRISTQNANSYATLRELHLYKRKINVPKDVRKRLGEFAFTNNGQTFLFSEIRYEINGVEIQKLKSPEISSSFKGLCSLTANDIHVLQNSGWNRGLASDNSGLIKNEMFSGSIPLKRLFRFSRTTA